MSADDALSWTIALAIMLFFSVLGLVTRVLGVDPFTLEFEASILYLPSGVLLLVVAMTRLRGRVGNPTER